jgi:hypothetical protein
VIKLIPNLNTAKYLESRKIKPTILNEAQKVMVRKAAKASALYGFMTLTLIAGVSLGGIVATLKIQDFFKNNEVAFALPVEMKVWTNRVVSVKPIKHEIIVLKDTKAMDEVVASSVEPTIAQKICLKFKDRCEVAVAVATAESNLRVDAIGVNTNGTTDIGIYQINFQTHKDKTECSLDKIATVDGNIDCAYRIYMDNGESFTPWVAFNTGAYLARLR